MSISLYVYISISKYIIIIYKYNNKPTMGKKSNRSNSSESSESKSSSNSSVTWTVQCAPDKLVVCKTNLTQSKVKKIFKKFGNL